MVRYLFSFCLYDLYGSRDLGFVGFCQCRELFLIMVSEAMNAMFGLPGKISSELRTDVYSTFD